MIKDKEINNVCDLVDVTIRDLYNIIVLKNPEKKVINVDCYLFGKRKIIKLPLTELKLYSGSAKSFLNYLKEKMTEGLGLNTINQLIKIKHAADNGTSLISNQGQALDGYSELANYRAIIGKFEKEKSDG